MIDKLPTLKQGVRQMAGGNCLRPRPAPPGSRTISFTVPGPVRGKQSPRMTKTGHTYMPKQTVETMNLIKMAFCQAAPQWEPWEGVVKLFVVAWHIPPKSWPQWKQACVEDGYDACMKTPDCDNVLKAVCDALNKIAYHDDRQVVHVSASKRWGSKAKLDVSLTFEADKLAKRGDR